jgi:uncharacterized membrane protein
VKRPGRPDFAEISYVFCTGQLAGMMLAIAVAQVATANLPEESWTLRQQVDDELFRKVMPLVFATNVLALSVALVSSEKRKRRYFGAAGLFLIGTIADTMLINVPINVTISAWQAGSAPETWRLERDKWLQAHWLRTGFGAMSFALSAIGMCS